MISSTIRMPVTTTASFAETRVPTITITNSMIIIIVIIIIISSSSNIVIIIIIIIIIICCAADGGRGDLGDVHLGREILCTTTSRKRLSRLQIVLEFLYTYTCARMSAQFVL